MRTIDPDQYCHSRIAQLDRKVERRRVPFSGSLEFTRTCNLRCVHCYNLGPGMATTGTELDTARWKELLDEISTAGCLFLLITGGEPLLRPDFDELYLHAKRRGLVITLFSNGTLFDQKIMRLFTEYPPQLVEITLYGATAAAHERITGVSGSFERTRQAIEQLLKLSIRVKLKTVLLAPTIDELPQLEELARSYSVDFRTDAAVYPRFNGDSAPLRLRVPPARVVASDFDSAEKCLTWKNYHRRILKTPPPSSVRFCNAGVTTFHIDALGNLHPCLMATECRYDLARGTFLDGWRTVLSSFHEQPEHRQAPCLTCDKKIFCSACPESFRLEMGVSNQPSQYLCELGRLRSDRLLELTRQEFP